MAIEGPPGCGKSAFTAAKCLQIAANGGIGKTKVEKILFASRVTDDATFVILCLEPDTTTTTTPARATVTILERLVLASQLAERLQKILMDGFKPDFIVADGVVGNCAQSCWALFGGGSFPSLLCTSRQFQSSGKSHSSDVTFFPFCSWRLEEDYVSAFRCPPFVELVQRLCPKFVADARAMGANTVVDSSTEAAVVDANTVVGSSTETTVNDLYEKFLRSKYYYAGGSSRYMLDNTIDEINDGAEDLLDRAASDTSMSSEKHDGAVNTLKQRIRSKESPTEEDKARSFARRKATVVIISTFFAVQLAEQKFNNLLQQLVFCECDNPSVKGFVYEAQVICQTLLKKKLSLSPLIRYERVSATDTTNRHLDVDDVTFAVGDRQYFDDPKGVNYRSFPFGAVLVPRRWNNPTYDFAFVICEPREDALAQLSSAEKRAQEKMKKLQLEENQVHTRSTRSLLIQNGMVARTTKRRQHEKGKRIQREGKIMIEEEIWGERE